MNSLVFEEIEEGDFIRYHSAGCSNAPRSVCCTRVCTNPETNCNRPLDKEREERSDIEEWGKFLEIEGGVIQY